MTTGTNVRRAIVLAALIGLGVVAAIDLDLDYAPRITMPEANVRLSLPPSLSLQPTDVARTWAVPVETGIRAVGGVESLAGSVSTTGLDLVVRFAAGTDIETKVARIQSELEHVRSTLPPRSSLVVSADTFESRSFLALTGEMQPELVRQIEREIAAIPSVRAVQTYGSRRAATVVEVAADDRRADEIVAKARDGVTDIGRVSHLGVVNSGRFRVPVYARGPATLRDVKVEAGREVLSIDSVAMIEPSLTPRTTAGRYDGRSAIIMGVLRDSDTSLLTFDRELRRAIASIEARLPADGTLRIIQNEAEPLERLLFRLSIGLAAAALLLGVTGWLLGRRTGLFVGILVIPVSLSIALNLIRLSGIPLDLTTIQALALGLIVPIALVMVPTRSAHTHAWAVLTLVCGASLLLAVTFGAGPVATFLVEPAKAYAVGMASVAACLYLFPSIDGGQGIESLGKLIRGVLRASPTVILIGATACYALFVLFGKELDPRKSSILPDRGRVFVNASLPEGTTIEQAEEGASRLEEKIALVEGTGRVWGSVSPEHVSLVVDVLPDWQSPDEIEEITSDIRFRARLPFGRVTVRHGASEARLDTRSAELEPEADDQGLYALVLEGDDVANLERSVERLDLFVRGFSAAVRAMPEWGARSIRIELRPSSPGSQAVARLAASTVSSRAIRPRETPLGQDDLVLVRRAGEGDEWTPPSRRALLESPLPSASGFLVPVRHLRVDEEVVAPRVARQSGRFAVRVVVGHSGTIDLDHWLEVRNEIDRRLSVTPLTTGAEMKRPEIRPFRMDRNGIQLVVMAGVVPVLVLLISIIWTSSIWRFVPFVLPPVIGVAATTPLMRFTGVGVDEISLLMLAGACFGVLAVGLACAETLIRGRRVVADGYRSSAASALPVLGAALACAAFLLCSTIGTDAARDPWVSGFRIAGVAMFVAFPASVVFPSAAFFGLESLRRRRMPATKAKRRPVEWAGEGTISFEVRHVSKIYRGGFRALRDVSFELKPGIVGLLGPNGAGKTTLLRILTGLLLPTRGQVLYRGQAVGPVNIDAFREHIGFLPQSFNAYPGFTAEEFVDFWAMQAGITDRKNRAEEVETLIAAVGLEEHAGRKVRDFSGGMRQRIGIARALIGQPDLLVVDEPTTGLDIEGRSRFRGLMLSVAAHRIVVLSTHIAGDVEATCSRVLLIHRGRLRFDGAPDELLAKAEGRVFEMTVDDHDIAEISSRYRLTRRVRVMDGIRVKGVVPSGETLPGPEAAPGLEEAYLAEIELADAAVGRRAKFTFLFDA